MKAIIEFPTRVGMTCIPFEVEVNDLDAAGLMSSRGEMVAKAKESFQELMEAAKDSINTIVSGVKNNIEGADEMTVEFGLKVGLKYGLCITTSGDATIGIKLTYKKPQIPSERLS